MQTRFKQQFLATHDGKRADEILRSCVHCGFCTATCPTFLLTGNELDSPRGRIYLIKEALEDNPVSAITHHHLDRCLSCQSCETTCPSDVRYHELLNIGRRHLAIAHPRPWYRRVKPAIVGAVLTRKWLLNPLLFSARMIRPILPLSLRRQLRPRTRSQWQSPEAGRRMILLNGCVQGGLSPQTNAAAALVLSQLGIQAQAMEKEGCCGALHYHMNAQDSGLKNARRLIDQLNTLLNKGVETIISSASGCGNFIKDYPELFRNDPEYAEKSARVASHTRDLVQVLLNEDLSALKFKSVPRLAYQCPCTLQHGQQLNGAVEKLLMSMKVDFTPATNPHLCCGSAGTYSLFQPAMAKQLREQKLASMNTRDVEGIATANIGCQMHLSAASELPVRHWVEYLAEALEK